MEAPRSLSPASLSRIRKRTAEAGMHILIPEDAGTKAPWAVTAKMWIKSALVDLGDAVHTRRRDARKSRRNLESWLWCQTSVAPSVGPWTRLKTPVGRSSSSHKSFGADFRAFACPKPNSKLGRSFSLFPQHTSFAASAARCRTRMRAYHETIGI